MEVETIAQELDTEIRLQKAFERMIEIKHQRTRIHPQQHLIEGATPDNLNLPKIEGLDGLPSGRR